MSRAPRITDDILEGLGYALTSATAGSPGDIGRTDEQFEKVEQAEDWYARMVAHRDGRPAPEPQPRLPAKVLRGLDLAVNIAYACVEADQADEVPRYSKARVREFMEARAWVWEQERRAKGGRP